MNLLNVMTKIKTIGIGHQISARFFLQVDKHIRRLDTDLARFEADLKEKQIESTDYDSTSSKGKKGEFAVFALFCFHVDNLGPFAQK